MVIKTCSKLKWGHELQLIGFTKRNHSATFIEGGGAIFIDSQISRTT